MELNEYKNLGLIIEQPDKFDYYFGGEKEDYTREELTDGDWEKYLSSKELQISVYFDTKACVTFSSLNVLEAVFNYKLINNLFTFEQLNFLTENWYVVNGKVEFSDRYIAKLSNTSKNWNSWRIVADAIREWWLVPEFKYPYPITQRTPIFDWDDYYKTVPQDIIDLGKMFLEYFQLNYETVLERDFNNALPYSPIQIYVTAWYKNSEWLYYKPEDKRYNHAVTKFNREDQVFDHYNPFIKNLTPGYDYYNSGYIWFVNNMTNDKAKVLKDKNSSAVGVWLPAISEDVLKSYALNMSINLPMAEEGIDWDNAINGEFELK